MAESAEREQDIAHAITEARMEDGDDGDAMDREFQEGDCLEVDFDDDAPPLDADEPADDDQEQGTIGEDEVYGEGMEAVHDDSLAQVRHKESVLSVAFNPADRRMLVTGGQDDVAVIWAVGEGEGSGLAVTEAFRLEGHTDSVTQVQFSHDGQYVATASYDGTVRIWSPQTGKLVQALDGPAKEVEFIMWHPQGHVLLAGSADTMAWMWLVPSGRLMNVFAGHGQTVTCGCWGLGGKKIVTGSDDKGLIVWEPRTATPIHHLRELHDGSVLCLCAHPESPVVVSGSEDSTIRVIQIETGKVIQKLGGHEMGVEAVAFNHPGPTGLSLLATASMDGKIQVFDGKTFDIRWVIKDHVGEAGIIRFKWLPAPVYGSLLTTCATDGSARVFDGLAGKCLHTLTGHTNTVVDVDISLGDIAPGGQAQLAIASASEDCTCRIFAVALGGGTGQASSSSAGAGSPSNV